MLTKNSEVLRNTLSLKTSKAQSFFIFSGGLMSSSTKPVITHVHANNFPCEKINAFIFNDSSTKRIIILVIKIKENVLKESLTKEV
jgi:hypothetical protein